MWQTRLPRAKRSRAGPASQPGRASPTTGCVPCLARIPGRVELIARAAKVTVESVPVTAGTRNKALGSERMERKLRDALPGGDGALRAAVWEFMLPML
jgi:hypothetical protein